jgi:uncharacterized protein (TIGR02266 family)
MTLYCPFCSEEIPSQAIGCRKCETIYDADTLKYLTARSNDQLQGQLSERRKGIRVSMTIKVTYFSVQDFVKDYLFDLSAGGIFVRTHEPVDVGEKLQLQIFLPDKEKEMTVLGEVIWVRKEDDAKEKAKQPPGMGVRFLDPDVNDIKRIIRILSQTLR